MSGTRPRPPADLLELFAAPQFVPTPDLLDWLTSTFLDDGGALENPDHAHLKAALLGVLWTNVDNSRHGRRIVGQAEFRPPSSQGSRWVRARAEAQIIGWFGTIPDFLLTFDAGYAAKCSDAEFCALVEHELYHCGQERDEFGMPRFSKASGLPILGLRGHDVEQFIGVIRRYGAEAAGVAAAVAACQTADVPADRIAVACGTCG